MTVRITRKLGWILTALIAWLLALTAAASAQTAITLRPSATLAPDTAPAPQPGAPAAPRQILLSDIADLDPPTTPEAAAIIDLPIAPAAGTTEVSIADVRRALDAAKVNWGRITLRGSNCRISFTSSTPTAHGPTSIPAPTRTGLSQAIPQSLDLSGPQTLRSAISERLLALYAVEAADLRLAFDTADDVFLAELVGARRVDVQPASTGASVRTPVNIYIYEEDRLVTTRLVSVQALINRPVLTARAPIPRGQAISADQVESGRQWLGPNARPSATPDAAIGQVAAKFINTGAILTAPDITPPIVCKRGDIVWVHVLSGNVTVRAKCRAMAQARDGDLVQLKLDGSDRTFSARMSGAGRAVMIAEPQEATGHRAQATGLNP